MPYKDIKDLPKNVRNPLPPHAQEIYKEAFNSAWITYLDPAKRRGGESREQLAHQIAWAAVKKSYVKARQKWVRKK